MHALASPWALDGAGRTPAGVCPRHVPTPRSGSTVRDPGSWEGHPGFVASCPLPPPPWGSGSGPVGPPAVHPSTLPPVSHSVLAPVKSLSPTLQTSTRRHMEFIDRPVGTALPPSGPLKASSAGGGRGSKGLGLGQVVGRTGLAAGSGCGAQAWGAPGHVVMRSKAAASIRACGAGVPQPWDPAAGCLAPGPWVARPGPQTGGGL